MNNNSKIVNYTRDKHLAAYQKLNDDLYNACEQGLVDLVKNLLTKHNDSFDIFTCDKCFLVSCRKGHIQLAKLFMSKGVSDFSTGLRFACDNRHYELANIIVSSDNWNDNNSFFLSSLEIVCRHGQLELAKLLVYKSTNINLNILNKCLIVACYLDSTKKEIDVLELVNLFISRGANNFDEAINGACTSDNVLLAQFLIDNNKSNCTTQFDFNKLMVYSCMYGSLKCAKLMISHGGNAWNEGLLYACIKKNIDLIKLMFTNGATKLHVNGTHSFSDSHFVIKLFEGGVPETFFAKLGFKNATVEHVQTIIEEFRTIILNSVYTSLLPDLLKIVSLYSLI